MNKAKVPVIVLVVLAIVGLILAGAGFYLYQKERARGNTLQEQLDDLNTKQRIIENRLEDSKKMIDGLQSELKSAKLQIDTLAGQLQEEKSSREQASKQLEQLKADLEQQNNLRADLELKLNTAQDDVKKAQENLASLESQKQNLESKVKELEARTKNVELGKIVVNPDQAGAKPTTKKEEKSFLFFKKKPAPANTQPKVAASAKQQAVAEDRVNESDTVASGLEGKISVVNKEYGFVVISLGARDGVNTGDVFSVYHNGKLIGDVKAEKVHESLTAANLATDGLGDKIGEGDRVVRKGK